jgi:hypothetical protein
VDRAGLVEADDPDPEGTAPNQNCGSAIQSWNSDQISAVPGDQEAT